MALCCGLGSGNDTRIYRNNFDQEKLFSGTPSPEAESLLKNLNSSYNKIIGKKQNLITQVISQDEKTEWQTSLESVVNFVEKRSPEFATKLDILFGVSDFIFIKLDDIYKTEIVDAIINDKDKAVGLKELNLLKIDIKKINFVNIETKLKHGQKVYKTIMADFKSAILKYNDKDAKNTKKVLLDTVLLLESAFGKMDQSVSSLKNFVNFKETILNLNPKSVKLAYNLIGYKVGMSNLGVNSSAYEILGLHDWEKDNIEHIKMKYKTLVDSFAYLKNNTDVQDKLYEIIISILNEAYQTISQNF